MGFVLALRIQSSSNCPYAITLVQDCGELISSNWTQADGLALR